MMRSFLISLVLVSLCGCGPTIITRDNSLRAQLERELSEDDEGCVPEVRVQKLPTITPKPGLRHDDYPDYPYVVEPKGTYEDDTPQFVPKSGKVTKPARVKILDNKVGNPRSDEPVFDGKLNPDGEIPAKEFDPQTTRPNTGFQFKTGEVDPPPPSLQEMTQMGCSRGERVLRTAYARELDDIWLDFETQMNERTHRNVDNDAILRAARLALSDRDAALDEARQNFIWRLNQIHTNCRRTLHE